MYGGHQYKQSQWGKDPPRSPHRALLSQSPELIDELCPCAKVCVLRGGGILVSYLGVVTY